MRRRREGLALVAVIILVIVPASSLAGSPHPDPAQAILTIGANNVMKTRNVLVPLAMDDPFTMAVLARVYDTAVQRHPATGAVVPRLAVGVDGNANGVLDPLEVGNFTVPAPPASVTVFYDFTNARFHDGVPVTVMDVLFSYHVLALNPRSSGPLWTLMDRGGGPGSNATADRWLWVDAVADGDANPATAALRFTPQFPYAPFPFATLGIPVLPRHIWEGTGGPRHVDFGRAIYPEGDPRQGRGIPATETQYKPFDVVAAEAWQIPDADVIGSGHFKFVTWSIINAFVRLDANPDYAFGPPKVSSIIFKAYQTTQLGVLALQSGEISLYLVPLTPEFVPSLQNDPNIGLVNAPALFPTSFFFNMARQPFGYTQYPPADSRVDDEGLPFRQAFTRLIDRQTVVNVLLQTLGSIADSMVAPTNDGWYNTSLPRYPYDPASAGLTLDNAGWTKSGSGSCQTDGSGCRTFPRLGTQPFEILAPQADFDPILASTGAMVAAAARSVGVNVISKPTAFGTILSRVGAGDFDMALLAAPDIHAIDPWTLMRGDPDYLVDLFHSSNAVSGANRPAFHDDVFDTRAVASRSDADTARRVIDVQAMQGILADRLPVIPVNFRDRIWAYRSDRYSGWKLIASTLFNYWSLQDLVVAPNDGPRISLVSPPNGAIIVPGRLIDLDVVDTDLASVTYTLDGTTSGSLSSPYDIDTTTWSDGPHAVSVTATDSVGNTTRADFSYTIDGTAPSIALVSPADGALVPAETVIDVAVNDVNLVSVGLSVDGGSLTPFAAPYDYPTAGMADGPHTLRVSAVDAAVNTATKSYMFTLDATRPRVTIHNPEGIIESVPTQVGATFSEPVDRISVQSAFSMTDGEHVLRAANGTFYWSADRTSFTFVPERPLVAGREYRIVLAGTLADDAGNAMGADASWTFRPGVRSEVGLGIWVFATGIVAALAIILAVLVVFLFRRRRKSDEPTAKGKP